MNTDNKFDKNNPNDGYAIKANHILFVKIVDGNANAWALIGPAPYDYLLATALNNPGQEFIIALIVKHTENCF